MDLQHFAIKVLDCFYETTIKRLLFEECNEKNAIYVLIIKLSLIAYSYYVSSLILLSSLAKTMYIIMYINVYLHM